MGARLYIREIMNIDEMQFGFMPGTGTNGTIFVVRMELASSSCVPELPGLEASF